MLSQPRIAISVVAELACARKGACALRVLGKIRSRVNSATTNSITGKLCHYK